MTSVSTLAQHVLAMRDSKPIDDRVTVSVATSKDLRVIDAASYAAAGEHLTGYAGLLKEIDAYFKADIDRAYQLHKSLCAKRANARDVVEHESQRLRTERQAWKGEQDRLQREAEREAARVAQQQEQARLLAEAALLEAQHQPELAAAIVEEAISAPAPVVVLPSAVPKDLPKRKLWKWRIVNRTLMPRDFLIEDEKKLNGYASAMKDAARVPGVEFYSEEIDIVRG